MAHKATAASVIETIEAIHADAHAAYVAAGESLAKAGEETVAALGTVSINGILSAEAQAVAETTTGTRRRSAAAVRYLRAKQTLLVAKRLLASAHFLTLPLVWQRFSSRETWERVHGNTLACSSSINSGVTSPFVVSVSSAASSGRSAHDAQVMRTLLLILENQTAPPPVPWDPSPVRPTPLAAALGNNADPAATACTEDSSDDYCSDDAELVERLRRFRDLLFPIVFAGTLHVPSDSVQTCVPLSLRLLTGAANAGDPDAGGIDPAAIAAVIAVMQRVPFQLTYLEGDNDLASDTTTTALLEGNGGCCDRAARPPYVHVVRQSLPSSLAPVTGKRRSVRGTASAGDSVSQRDYSDHPPRSETDEGELDGSAADSTTLKSSSARVSLLEQEQDNTGQRPTTGSEGDSSGGGGATSATGTESHNKLTVCFPTVRLSRTNDPCTYHLLCVSQPPTRFGELPHSFIPVVCASEVRLRLLQSSAFGVMPSPASLSISPSSAVSSAPVVPTYEHDVTIDEGRHEVVVRQGMQLALDVLVTTDDVIYDVEVSLHRHIGRKGQSLCFFTRNYTAAELPQFMLAADQLPDKTAAGKDGPGDLETRWLFPLVIPLFTTFSEDAPGGSSYADSVALAAPCGGPSVCGGSFSSQEEALSAAEDPLLSSGSAVPNLRAGASGGRNSCTPGGANKYVLQIDVRQSSVPTAVARETFTVVHMHPAVLRVPDLLSDDGTTPHLSPSRALRSTSSNEQRPASPRSLINGPVTVTTRTSAEQLTPRSISTCSKVPLSRVRVRSFAPCRRGALVLYHRHPRSVSSQQSTSSETPAGRAAASNNGAKKAPEAGLGFTALNVLSETLIGLGLTDAAIQADVQQHPREWVLSASPVEVEKGVVLLARVDGSLCCRLVVPENDSLAVITVQEVYRPALPLTTTLNVAAARRELCFSSLHLLTLTTEQELLRTPRPASTTPPSRASSSSAGGSSSNRVGATANATITILQNCLSFALWPLQTGEGYNIAVAFQLQPHSGDSAPPQLTLTVLEIDDGEILFQQDLPPREKDVAAAVAAAAQRSSHGRDGDSNTDSRHKHRHSHQHQDQPPKLPRPPRVVFVSGNEEGVAGALLWSSRTLMHLSCGPDGWQLRTLWSTDEQSIAAAAAEDLAAETHSAPLSSSTGGGPQPTYPPAAANGGAGQPAEAAPEVPRPKACDRLVAVCAVDSPCAPLDPRGHCCAGPDVSTFENTLRPGSGTRDLAAFMLFDTGDIYGLPQAVLSAPEALATSAPSTPLGLVYSGAVLTDLFAPGQHKRLRQLAMRYVPLELPDGILDSGSAAVGAAEGRPPVAEKGLVYLYAIVGSGGSEELIKDIIVLE